MINSREWLQSRRRLLDQVKNQVQIRLGPMPRALERYSKNLDKDFGRVWKSTSETDLKRSIRRAKIVLSSDFHAYTQSQRAHLRLLRNLVGSRPTVLVLECLQPKHEVMCARFLIGDLSEAEFLTAVEWEKNWGFPWENYRPLFEFARDHGLEVRGVFQSVDTTLKQRDEWTSKRLLHIHKELPHQLLFVIMGEWHFAKDHLPKRLRKHLGIQDVLVLHQDAEQLYFRLATKGREGRTELLRGPGNQFCLMGSPPWMKWQSYLMYLEETYDRDLQGDFTIDYTEHIFSLIELLESDLKVHVKKTKLEVYSAQSKFSSRQLKLSAKERKALVYHLENGLSFYLPQRGWCYLSRPTINHAAGLAGQFLHGQLSKRTASLWNLPVDFLPLVWVEAVGFFFSKWINPKRKAESLENIRLQLASLDPKNLGRQALLLTLDHRLSEVLWVRTGRMRQTRYRPKQVGAFLDAARILGGMLGERLFQKVRSRTISLSKLMSYLRINMDEKDFAKFYWKLVREIELEEQ